MPSLVVWAQHRHALDRIDLGEIAVTPVFGWLSALGGIAEREMLRTFNCGVGMVCVVAPEAAEALAADLTARGETVTRLGEITAHAGDGPRVVYRGKLAL